jgi:hypothetical protein
MEPIEIQNSNAPMSKTEAISPQEFRSFEFLSLNIVSARLGATCPVR